MPLRPPSGLSSQSSPRGRRVGRAAPHVRLALEGNPTSSVHDEQRHLSLALTGGNVFGLLRVVR